MQKKVVITAVVVVVAGVIIWQIVTAAGDEAPIRVRNGSMTIDTEDGTWQDEGGAWSNETVKKEHKGDFWVRVTLTDGTDACEGQGHPVHVEYSAGGFKAIFTVAGNPARTKVSPRGQLTKETDQRLSHGASGGYITGVRINGSLLSCNITATNLDAVRICSSPEAKDCKDP
jgi:hypothetical protein